MPKGTKVSDCVEALLKQGISQATAIATCQKQTGQSYQTGEPTKEHTPRLEGYELIDEKLKDEGLV